MKILLTEEARDMLIPLIIRSSKGAEDIIKVRPAELLNSIESLDKLNDVINLRRGLWKGAAIGAGLTAAYYIYKNFKLKCKVSDLEGTMALNELKNKADDIISKFDSEEEAYESEEA